MAKQKKKRMNWQCQCDHETATKDEMIVHVRREHPKNGYWLWDICEDVGDEFANSALQEQKGRLQTCASEVNRLRAKSDLYDKLLVRYNSLANAVRIGRMALDEYVRSHETETK